MGKKRKLQQFAEVKTFDHFFEFDYHSLMQKGFPLKGKWNSDFFNNNHPIILELGCGKGEYSVGLAQMFPDNNYIGIDRKGARMWRGAKISLLENLKNVAFIRGQVQNIEFYFEQGEVSQIWITFPDPQLQSPRIRKRLTHPIFLDHYRRVLSENHLIHLKTDNDTFFEYTLEIINEHNHQLLCCSNDMYNDCNKEIGDEVRLIQTFYEKMWLKEGAKIKYLCFKL